MKLNIIKVLNTIAAEEATVVKLNDPKADWNATAESDLKNAYDYYKLGIEMENADAWDLIEWLDKHGEDYSHVKIEKIMSFDEWKEKNYSKYLIAA